MDYFNKSERIKQKQFAKWRDDFLSPITTWLVKNNINQNQISFLGVIFLVVACFVNPQYYPLVAFLMGGYLFCDAIDGGVARQKNEQSNAGSIIDITSDQVGVVFIAAAFIHYYDVNTVLSLIFSNFYVAFIVLVVFLNEKGVSVFKFIRVKYIFFALYVFSSLLPLFIIDYFLVIFSFYYLVVFVIGLRLMIKNKNLI